MRRLYKVHRLSWAFSPFFESRLSKSLSIVTIFIKSKNLIFALQRISTSTITSYQLDRYCKVRFSTATTKYGMETFFALIYKMQSSCSTKFSINIFCKQKLEALCWEHAHRKRVLLQTDNSPVFFHLSRSKN